MDKFDSAHKKTKRQYQKGRLIQLDKLVNKDPNSF